MLFANLLNRLRGGWHWFRWDFPSGHRSLAPLEGYATRPCGVPLQALLPSLLEGSRRLQCRSPAAGISRGFLHQRRVVCVRNPRQRHHEISAQGKRITIRLRRRSSLLSSGKMRKITGAPLRFRSHSDLSFYPGKLSIHRPADGLDPLCLHWPCASYFVAHFVGLLEIVSGLLVLLRLIRLVSLTSPSCYLDSDRDQEGSRAIFSQTQGLWFTGGAAPTNLAMVLMVAPPTSPDGK